MKSNTYTKQLIVLLGVLAVGMVALRWWLSSRSVPQVTRFEECAALDGSVIQESYPAVCVTRDGQRLVAPTPEPLPEPTPTPADLLTSYENPWYRIAYPTNWRVLTDERVVSANQGLLMLATMPSSTTSATLTIRVNRADSPDWLNQACIRLISDDSATVTDVVSGQVQLYDLGSNARGTCEYEGITGAILRFEAEGTDFQIDYVQDEADMTAAKDFEELLYSFEPTSATQSAQPESL